MFLAQVTLRNPLAQLPARISISRRADSTDSSNSLLGDQIEGIWGVQHANFARLQEPIHLSFVNWNDTSEGIISFTRRYGLLDEEGRFADLRDLPGRPFQVNTYSWRQSQSFFQGWWNANGRNDREQLPLEIQELMMFPVALESLAFKRGMTSESKIVWEAPQLRWFYKDNLFTAELYPKTLWQYLCLLLLSERLGTLRQCANHLCQAPFFRARRKDQTYCGSDCSERVAKRRWWELNGKNWRRERRHKQRKG
jgi:hypothetical protein